VKQVLAKLAEGRHLDEAQMEAAVSAIMDEQASPAQIGAFLALLRSNGETTEELVGAVRAMREHSVRVEVDGPVLDTCGTGGDGQGTFNISTASTFVCAAAGAKVAKHGNRAASGKVGAADVLEALGARIELDPTQAARVLSETGTTFLFAPVFHPAVRFVAQPRRELGFRTLFNLTGPLCNPAGAQHQLLGIFSADWLDVVADALVRLGTVHTLVVHGHDGGDEISLSGPTEVVEIRDGRKKRFTIKPEDFGIAPQPMSELKGGDAAENAAIIRDVLSGADGAPGDVVALNAGAALYAADLVTDLQGGIARAGEVLRSGAALETLDAFVRSTQEAGS
jgi:anthranilate phosphoribosyltransferase